MDPNAIYDQMKQIIDDRNAEIERLRAELREFTELKEYAKSLGQETYLELHADNERLRASRNDAIEECARVVEKSFIDSGGIMGLDNIAAAIRALKEKP